METKRDAIDAVSVERNPMPMIISAAAMTLPPTVCG